MAPQAAERIAYARAGRWRYRIASAKRDADNLRAQARGKILAALGNLHPSWIDHYAHDLERAVRPDQPDLARDRLQRAAADLRESSSERAQTAAALKAAGPQQQLRWLDREEAAAEEAWRTAERVESPRMPPPEEQWRMHHGPHLGPDVTPPR